MGVVSLPLVTIVIPTRNMALYLWEAIESIQRQTFQDWELIVVDNESTDDTPERIALYLKDSRIAYIYQKNQERAIARNRGADHGSGRYVAFLDADDLWLPGKIAAQLRVMEAEP